MLGVARLVDLLGGEERLLALVLVGRDQPGELGGDPLLADEERGQIPGHIAALLIGEAGPVLLVLGEVDRLGHPVLLLPQLVELLGVHQLDGGELGLVGDRADVALLGQIEERGRHEGASRRGGRRRLNTMFDSVSSLPYGCTMATLSRRPEPASAKRAEIESLTD